MRLAPLTEAHNFPFSAKGLIGAMMMLDGIAGNLIDPAKVCRKAVQVICLLNIGGKCSLGTVLGKDKGHAGKSLPYESPLDLSLCTCSTIARLPRLRNILMNCPEVSVAAYAPVLHEQKDNDADPLGFCVGGGGVLQTVSYKQMILRKETDALLHVISSVDWRKHVTCFFFFRV